MRQTTLFLLIIILLLSLSCPIHAQPEIEWAKTYGGRHNDVCYSLTQTADGGFALAGVTYSFGAGRGDYWLVRTDEDGDSLWSRTFGGGELDQCHSIVATADDGFALAGFTSRWNERFEINDDDFWLVRTDENGDGLWQRDYGRGHTEHCHSLVETDDGGFVLAGLTGYWDYVHLFVADFLLVKTSRIGNSLGMTTYGEVEGNEASNSLIQTADGGFALAGFAEPVPTGPADFWLVRTTGNRQCVWVNTYGGEGNESAAAVIQTNDGGFALAGYTEFPDAGRNFFLVRTNENGDSLWSRNYNARGFDNATSLIHTPDGGFVIGGSTSSSAGGVKDFWLVRTDSNGESIWSSTYGGRGDDICTSIIQTADGGFVLAGYTDSYGVGGADFWLVRTEPDPVSVPGSDFIPHPSSLILYPAYPNPFNSTTTIQYALPSPGNVTLCIYNSLGQQVGTEFEGLQFPGFHTATLTAKDLSSGLYFVVLQSGEEVLTRKVMLVK